MLLAVDCVLKLARQTGPQKLKEIIIKNYSKNKFDNNIPLKSMQL